MRVSVCVGGGDPTLKCRPHSYKNKSGIQVKHSPNLAQERSTGLGMSRCAWWSAPPRASYRMAARRGRAGTGSRVGRWAGQSEGQSG